jgi:outer membrane protein assembly factor BamA
MFNYLSKKISVFLRPHRIVLLMLFAGCMFSTVRAQDTARRDSDAVPETDLADVIKKILKKRPDSIKTTGRVPLAILPSIGYNPSMGFIIGAKISGGLQKGSPSNTNYSVIGLEAVYSSKGIITVQARHNIFTAFNKWNFQGNWQFSKYGQVDYGLGTGYRKYRSHGFVINDLPTRNGDSSFPIKYNYVRLMEKVYHRIGAHSYLGGGLNFDLFAKIDDEKVGNTFSTPHERYSLRHDFDPKNYNACGALLTFQYNTREHPIRSYGGIYLDLSFRFNHELLGSTKNAVQFSFDFRKYWSLSKRNPAHVLALWLWSNYRLGGDIPYLALPYTSSDTYNRSGRGYTLGRFKGLSFSYFETEYRFPITRNKLLSGVCFFNLESGSNDFNKKLYSAWEPAGGAGLRILFQKQSRTTICIDFAKGNYGSSGIFFGLNEAF